LSEYLIAASAVPVFHVGMIETQDLQYSWSRWDDRCSRFIEEKVQMTYTNDDVT
jgi:hypothetical protein